MPDVLDIEKSCFETYWTEEDFLTCLRQRNCIGLVAELDGRVAGFVIYELHKDRLRFLNFAVHPECQNNGVGTAIVNRMKEKLSQQRRESLLLTLRESNLKAQLFFRSQGFRATGIVKGYYEDYDEDAIEMRYTLGGEKPPVFEGRNRIAEFLC